ncbi:hypothetical protein GQ600_4076 [Phytophthora cactorum]|nr:hypothetical protein GQ600_4076 [Phytophthora cactorum]
MRRPRLVVLTALSILLWGSGIVAQSGGIVAAKSPAELQQPTPSTADVDAEANDCSSLSGPFCAHTGSMAFYASYMTPISTQDLHQEGTNCSDAARRPTKAWSSGKEKSASSSTSLCGIKLTLKFAGVIVIQESAAMATGDAAVLATVKTGWNIPTREDVSVLPSLCGFVKDGLIGTGRQILRRIEELAAEFLESLSVRTRVA